MWMLFVAVHFVLKLKYVYVNVYGIHGKQSLKLSTPTHTMNPCETQSTDLCHKMRLTRIFQMNFCHVHKCVYTFFCMLIAKEKNCMQARLNTVFYTMCNSFPSYSTLFNAIESRV